ncbi:helix-turn-helix domain-containing protein [Shewanella dokdonensis]
MDIMGRAKTCESNTLDTYKLYRANMVDNQRLIGEFLRAKREQIAPAMVGLPQPKRSRTRGLRREDVAELSGISTVWYSKIERGQAAGISSSVVCPESGFTA